MASFSTLKIQNQTLGAVTVKIDSEDKSFIVNSGPHVCKTGEYYYIRLIDSETRVSGPYAHRAILENHGKLEYSKNLKPKNGDHFDLRKKNWI